MLHVCTITTADYYWKVQALRDSLLAYEPATRLHVLCADEEALPAAEGITHYGLTAVSGEVYGAEILRKYSGDKLRWSLKPVFMAYLLQQGISKLMYVDNDIYFTAPFSFLEQELESANMLLTPHDYPGEPGADSARFEAHFRIGLFNAGFVGATNAAIPWLNRWASYCVWRCEQSAFRGLYDDQKYLDLLSVVNPGLRILRHSGCNVAEWNRHIRPRLRHEGKTLVGNPPQPLVFIHFNRTTCNALLGGEDAALYPYFEEYVAVLQKYFPGLQAMDLYKADSYMHRVKRVIRDLFTRYE
jgi:hypothetical protein